MTKISGMATPGAFTGAELIHGSQTGTDVKFPFAKASATVAATEGTASTSYVDLATAGPSVTLVTGTSVIIDFGAVITKSAGGAGNNGFMAPAVSGASTIAASDANSRTISAGNSGIGMVLHRRFKMTGLTPGTNTFKMQYKANGGGTWTWGDRDVTVERLD